MFAPKIKHNKTTKTLAWLSVAKFLRVLKPHFFKNQRTPQFSPVFAAQCSILCVVEYLHNSKLPYIWHLLPACMHP